MIDFRYHIVSIIAIFLALGLGVVVGTTVLDRVTVDALEGRLDDLQERIGNHRETITELDAERDRANDLVRALAPEAIDGVLVGMRVVFVSADDEEWHARARKAITDAGADDVGSIVLTSKWVLAETPDRDDLIRAFGDLTLAERDPASDGAAKLGELLTGVEGAALLARLGDAGFVRSTPQGDVGTFPLPTASLVVLGSETKVPLAAFARGAARVAPTLALAGSVERLGPVATLRRMDDPPGRSATFDSASDDPSGVGTVLAMRAAADGTGGHFGLGPGLLYLPAPP